MTSPKFGRYYAEKILACWKSRWRVGFGVVVSFMQYIEGI